MKIRLSDYVARFLVENNIRDIFTVTGGGAMFLNDSFGNNPNLHCIYNHHEQASAIASEGYVRSSGKMCAVCVTTGPGGTNTLTGVLGSWQDSIPMLVISGQVKFVTTIKSTNLPLRQLGDQEFNITDCVKTMTKYSFMVTDPNTIKYHLKKALYIATHGRPGPVWLDIPINVQAAIIDTDNLAGYDENEDKQINAPILDTSKVDQMLQRIQDAKKPIILVGTGITISNSKNEFLKVLDILKIPVVSGWNAHDILSDDNPYYCGRQGTAGTRAGNFNFQDADLVIALGSRMSIRQVSYNWENFAKNAFLCAVDIDKAELDKPTINVGLKIHADVKDVLNYIIDSNYVANEKHASWLQWAKSINDKYPIVIEKYYEKTSPINPYVFINRATSLFAEDEIIVCGNGTSCIVGMQAIVIKKKTRHFTNSGCASMGYGYPSAIGASVANNGKRIVCFDGDGSFMMNLQELQTAVFNNLNVKLFLLNNNGYHSIRQTQTNTFDKHFCGVDKDSGISFPDFEKVIKAFGITYFKLDNVEDIDKKVTQTLNADGPVVCEVVLDSEQFFEPKLSCKRLDDGSIVSPSLEDMFPFLNAEEIESNHFKG